MRIRTAASDVLFTLSALAAVVGVHKYIFGDFPKLWLVHQWPWHAVDPWAACGLSLVLAWVAARLARSKEIDVAPPLPAPATLLFVGERIPTEGRGDNASRSAGLGR